MNRWADQPGSLSTAGMFQQFTPKPSRQRAGLMGGHQHQQAYCSRNLATLRTRLAGDRVSYSSDKFSCSSCSSSKACRQPYSLLTNCRVSLT